MTKSEAYDILSKTVRDACISDVIYEQNPSAVLMIAILSEIDSVNVVLSELVERDDAE